MSQQILKNDVNNIKYWVITSRERKGPFDSLFLAERAATTIPTELGEIPKIVQLTESGQQILLG